MLRSNLLLIICGTFLLPGCKVMAFFYGVQQPLQEENFTLYNPNFEKQHQALLTNTQLRFDGYYYFVDKYELPDSEGHLPILYLKFFRNGIVHTMKSTTKYRVEGVTSELNYRSYNWGAYKLTKHNIVHEIKNKQGRYDVNLIEMKLRKDELIEMRFGKEYAVYKFHPESVCSPYPLKKTQN